MKESISYPGYMVREDGVIYGRSGKVLKQSPNPRNGYLQVAVCKIGPDGKMHTRTVNVHSIVCEAFHGAKPTGMHEVAHGNGIRTDNRSTNLRWATRSENQRDRIQHGTYQYGELNPNSKLGKNDVIFIRENASLGSIELSRRYGISERSIRKIIDRSRWGHI